MRDIERLEIEDIRECSDVIRGLGSGAASMEVAARRIVRYLYDELGDAAGQRACPLVRLYKTHPFEQLEPDLQTYVQTVLEEAPQPDLRCLTLLGTAGDEEAWNDRRRSAGHQAIPLQSEAMVRQLPMVTQLITQLGLELDTVLRPDLGHAVELSKRTYDVFHVATAAGSPHLPDQKDFVLPHKIASALGFGGMLYTGDFYAVVLFSRVPISADAAQMIKILAIAMRVPLLTHLRQVFEPEPASA